MAERRNHLLLVGLILVALAASVLMIVPGTPFHKKATLGLDLQGGLEVILQAIPPENRDLTEADLDRSLEIIRNRVDKIGVSEPTITKQGTDQISVQLPGVKDAERAQDLIGQTAKLELYDLETTLTGPSISADTTPVPSENLYDLMASAQTRSLAKKNGEGGPFYLFDKKTKRILAGPLRTKAEVLQTKAAGGKVGEGQAVYGVPKKTVVITCGGLAVLCPPGFPPEKTYYYLFKYQPDAEEPIPQMTGEDLKLSGTRADFGQGGEAVVLMQFTNKGGDTFQRITREEWVRGRIRNSPQHFAIVLDREIRSFPQIDYRDATLSNGIGGNSAQITGLDSVQESKDLALVLQTGALPVEFRTLSQTQVSATLGQDSLRQALRASIIGMLIVAVFLLVFYRFLGLVAVLGLGIYAVILYATILIFNVTLTLPGFAGMILTIGVAADANIVIFERIKEESRAGKSVRAAIGSGYAKGFHTIVDANVVTAITALILFALATAQVRGFALMLLIGTAISVVTAVFATRAFLGLLAGFRWFQNPAFMGASAREIPPWQRLDICGRRRIWFGIAAVLIAASILSIAVKGLNLGIDFRGGTQLEFSAPRPVAIQDVREVAKEIGQGNASIQGVGREFPGQRYQDFKIRAETLDTAEQRQLTSSLQRRFDAASRGARAVSESFSKQILLGAIYAMIASFILISLYITLRFQWRFAVPILRTIVNDGLIAVGVYSISGREVTAATVAAFLTIIGYSIYDTIIIFDRVRENLGLMRRGTINQLVNVSLWETIPRSLATTFITLLPVSALFFFGGETLKDFAFAILIGIGVSAFSTIFIAAPFLAVLLERKPEYARRVETPVAKDAGVELFEEATEAAADEPVPALAPLTSSERTSVNEAKRERRRQRRRARPHGRAR